MKICLLPALNTRSSWTQCFIKIINVAGMMTNNNIDEGAGSPPWREGVERGPTLGRETNTAASLKYTISR